MAHISAALWIKVVLILLTMQWSSSQDLPQNQQTFIDPIYIPPPPAQPSPPRLITTLSPYKPPCTNMVYCFVSPCQYAKCPLFPNAICRDDYCGGCNAIFTDINTGKQLTYNQCNPPWIPSLPTTIQCTMDVKTCPDGSSVGRDSLNNCQFKPCPLLPAIPPYPAPPIATTTPCTIRCITYPCPCNPPIPCTMDVRACPDGSFVGRDGHNNCEFEPCPDPPILSLPTNPEPEPYPLPPVPPKPLPPISPIPKPCLMVYCIARPCDIASCPAYPDATCTDDYCGGCNAIFTDIHTAEVLTDNQCNPTSTSLPPIACTEDLKQCPDGSYVARDDTNNCEFKPCPLSTATKPVISLPVACTMDAKQCPDGSYVGRDGMNNCEFRPCPPSTATKPVVSVPVMCTMDVRKCADGSFVGRDGMNNCEFKPCPDILPLRPVDPLKPVVSTCAAVGDTCTSDTSSISGQCCDSDIDGNNKCSVDALGGQLGICCVMNGKSGCKVDADCCEVDSICNTNGICRLNRAVLRAQAARKVEGDFDNFEMIEDIKGSRYIAVSEATIAAVLIIILFIFPVLYYLYYKKFIVKEMKKQARREVFHGLEVDPHGSDNEFADSDNDNDPESTVQYVD